MCLKQSSAPARTLEALGYGTVIRSDFCKAHTLSRSFAIGKQNQWPTHRAGLMFSDAIVVWLIVRSFGNL